MSDGFVDIASKHRPIPNQIQIQHNKRQKCPKKVMMMKAKVGDEQQGEVETNYD